MPHTRAHEVNFDGLVGPTHNYGGLSFGNVASTRHRAAVSNPREAALQGLRKMKAMTDLGLKQAVLPPQERPDLETLRRVGFTGSDHEVIEKAAKEAPAILQGCYSASTMWTANAATVCPSADSADRKVHFTPANLTSKFHRAIEPDQTARTLRAIFHDPDHFTHHEWLPSVGALGDEGAANHTRFCEEYGSPGLQFFVYGRYGFESGKPEPAKFPARQTLEACQALARLHGLKPGAAVFAQQNPEAIDAGVFHNDVASVGNRNFFFTHEKAFLDQKGTLQALQDAYHRVTGGKALEILEVPASSVSLSDAVQSYLFNSQIVSTPKDGMALIAPIECSEMAPVKAFLDTLGSTGGSAIRQVHYFDLKQSMRNGGGPACLRLRVVLTEAEIAQVSGRVFMTAELFGTLSDWVRKHYRDRLSAEDLADPKLAEESRAALDELTGILGLGSIYPFQRPRRAGF